MTMAAAGYPHLSGRLRPNALQRPYTLSNPPTQSLDREVLQALPTESPTTVIICQLPKGITLEQLHLLVLWSDEIVDMEVLPETPGEQYGSAKVEFRSAAGAMEAKNRLDGKQNMLVDIVDLAGASRNYASEAQIGTASADSSSTGSSAPASRRGAHFSGAFSGMGSLSPHMVNSFALNNELPSPENSGRYRDLFSPHSPIGNHLNDLPRISGKSLITHDSVDDDETRELLKDPVAYAENGASTSQRRATAPQLPISQLASLSLNTNLGPGPSPGPSSLPPYGHHNVLPPGHRSAMSPTATHGGGGHGAPFAMGSPHHSGHPPLPAINPADRNPPCNTLYVGNLPINTSEEELKAMFSKQRGYKRLCFRTKHNGPMCFVEFEDIACASKALTELYGRPLHNSTAKGGIRLSFSKNPLGVRSGQNTGQGAGHSMTGMMPGPSGGFMATNGPPPGLAAPPGLGHGRYGGGPSTSQAGTPAGFPAAGGPSPAWAAYDNGPMTLGGPNSGVNGQNSYIFIPSHMMGR
ncbi:hypothetical protein SODALDRAFT_321351 [Sodiomyces alkalinus F11]|uniref:RRM domain-containing protein n=1 Tax=Sodiomyces alkalinus (strain CBS 110278 / VKM F-3762 / F11) TaxID=1314773 RepID=A0A3N2PJH1_SODAK|nr:hypothetical protein SODALDRAFT_321351 [Sodiomyces alkalinus F11]ROT34677.1 hypothetical protein SODALDRAFT_321351 [Sodiomyces alkalinus F11]